MTRRMLDSAIWKNEKFGVMPPMARLLAIGIINQADDQGRGKAHPVYLRSQIFPYDDVTAGDVAGWLAMVAENETILIYQVDGKDYYQILNWWAYQSHQYAMPSQYPKPDGWSDRIRKTLKPGTIITCNWITSDGKRTPDTCDEQGVAYQVNEQVIDQVNEQVKGQDKDKDKDLAKDKDHVEMEVIPPAAQPPTKPARVVTPGSQQDMFGAVAETCQLDAKLKTGQIAKQAKALLEAGYTPAQVRAFPAWWQSHDWRGQRGNVPTLAQLAELIKQSTTNTNGTDPGKKREVNRLDRILGVDIHGNPV